MKNFFRSGLRPLFEFAIQVLRNLVDTLRELGELLAEVATMSGPLLAPMAPAAFSYMHLTTLLNFEWWVALVVALAIETLGLSTGSTIIGLMMHNRRNPASKNQIPMQSIIVSGVWYILTVVALNVTLSIVVEFPNLPLEIKALVHIITQGVLVLLSVPAIITQSIRMAHSNVIREIMSAKQEKSMARNLHVNTGNLHVNTGNSTSKKKWADLTDEEIEFLATATRRDAAELLGRSPDDKTVYNYRVKAQNGRGELHE
jgi:hypothetical protein